MTIALDSAGKRFNRDWIFRRLNYTFHTGTAYAITGSNGSGKSTLLQALSGSMMLNEGSCAWWIDNSKIAAENIFRYISYCAPYLEPVEEFTLTELLQFHQSFKPFISGLTVKDVINEIGLSHAAGKKIQHYSSGMKQRAKLAQCIFSDTPLVLLDEPCTNLDQQGIDLYNHLIDRYCKNRLVIVSSNDPVEYGFCREVVAIQDYKL